VQTFNIRDLRQRTGELVRNAEAGHLALVTKHGKPAFLALPLSEQMFEHGVHVAIALKLFEEGVLSLGKAAKVGRMAIEPFIEVLGQAGIDAVSYPVGELADELKAFE